MTVHLDLPADIVEQLSEKARQQGLTLDAYVLQAVSSRQESEPDWGNDEEKSRRHREAVAAIRELRKQVKPDPEGWTSRDYINFGRR